MQKRKFNKQKGMTLFEVILVIGIMGAISSGVILLSKSVIDNQNMSNLNQSLNTIQLAMLATYGTKKAYPDVKDEIASIKLTEALISMGKLSKSDFVNPVSGYPIRIYSVTNNHFPNKGFAIKASNLSQPQCRALIGSGSDLFEFIQVELVGGVITPDMDTLPNATAITGVIKSPKGGINSFDITNVDQMAILCGGAAGKDVYYDVFVGGR